MSNVWLDKVWVDIVIAYCLIGFILGTARHDTTRCGFRVALATAVFWPLVALWYAGRGLRGALGGKEQA